MKMYGMGIKKLLCFFTMLLLGFQAMSQLRSNKDLIGKWAASSLKLEFFPDARVNFAMKGGSIPGARYRSDFTQTPPLLIIELLQQTKKRTYSFILEFINDKSFRLTTKDADAGSAFDKQRSVILQKEK